MEEIKMRKQTLELVVGGSDVGGVRIRTYGWPDSIGDLARYEPASKYLAASEENKSYEVIPAGYEWAA